MKVLANFFSPFVSLYKLTKVAFSPRGLSSDMPVRDTFRKANLPEFKSGIKRVASAKDVRIMKRRFFSHDFRV